MSPISGYYVYYWLFTLSFIALIFSYMFARSFKSGIFSSGRAFETCAMLGVRKDLEVSWRPSIEPKGWKILVLTWFTVFGVVFKPPHRLQWRGSNKEESIVDIAISISLYQYLSDTRLIITTLLTVYGKLALLFMMKHAMQVMTMW